MNNIKVLPLEPWMKRKDRLTFTYLNQIEVVFGKPNLYLNKDKCWFELDDGTAYEYNTADFNRKLADLQLPLLSSDEYFMLKTLQQRNELLLSASQCQMIWKYETKQTRKTLKIQSLRRIKRIKACSIKTTYNSKIAFN